MTRIVLEIPQNQDVDFLLTLLNRLNIKVVAKTTIPPMPSKSETFSLNDFQQAMDMTDEDMELTFGEEYLQEHQWQPQLTHA